MSGKRKGESDQLADESDAKRQKHPWETAKKQEKFRQSVYWDNEKSLLKLVDQKILPTTFQTIEVNSCESVAKHIKIMTVRGAPAIGAAGAYGFAMAVRDRKATNPADLLKEMKLQKSLLDAARPTAVNLTWATSIMFKLVESMVATDSDFANIEERILQEAHFICQDDVSINKRLGAHGAKLIPEGANILHHCNTGKLATVDYGTALGVIYTAHEQGKKVHVWVDETRPRLQGARLTAWELMQAHIPMHLVADNAAGLLMYSGKVDVILFGADRVTANGDVANKIGTYKVAVCGKENSIPVYACVPCSTIDLSLSEGSEIEIEERDSKEVLYPGPGNLTSIAPEGCKVFNPAFDVTPARYLTGIITEEGVCYPPFEQSLRKAVLASREKLSSREKRMR